MSDESVSAPPAADTAEWRPAYSPWLIAVSVMLGTFMEVLDTSVANVALPHIAGNLSSTPEEATWVLTSYLVSNAIILPASAWLSGVFGRKRFLIACIVIFTASSALCGAADSLGMLIAARVLQGAGGGALQPIAQAILLESFPPAKRGLAMATYSMGVIVAPILGPTVGGWITDNYSWRWIFYINMPVGIAAALMAQAFIEDPPYLHRTSRQRIDYWGMGFLVLWLGTLQIVLDKGQEDDWLAAVWVRWFLVISALSMVAFIYRELHADEPIVNLGVLGNRNFALGTVLITAMGVVLYSTTALLPLFLQTLLGYSALQAGLAISLTFDVSQANVVWATVLNGIATPLIFIPLSTTAVGTLRTEQLGQATGIYNLMRNTGGSLGISAVATLLARRAQVHQAVLVRHLTPYDPAYRKWLDTMQRGLAARVGSIAAVPQSMGLLYRELTRQATLLAFVDNFKLISLLAICCLPLAVLFQRVRARRAGGKH